MNFLHARKAEVNYELKFVTFIWPTSGVRERNWEEAATESISQMHPCVKRLHHCSSIFAYISSFDESPSWSQILKLQQIVLSFWPWRFAQKLPFLLEIRQCQRNFVIKFASAWMPNSDCNKNSIANRNWMVSTKLHLIASNRQTTPKLKSCGQIYQIKWFTRGTQSILIFPPVGIRWKIIGKLLLCESILNCQIFSVLS